MDSYASSQRFGLSYVLVFTDTPPTELYTLSLHDALPIWQHDRGPGDHQIELPGQEVLDGRAGAAIGDALPARPLSRRQPDRKSTRLNSSHEWISYAVFCLKKKT